MGEVTWKHVTQHAIEALRTICLHLIDRGQAGTVLGLLGTLGVMALFLLVAVRLPPHDLADAMANVAGSVWTLASGILATIAFGSLWTLRIQSRALHDEAKALAGANRMDHDDEQAKGRGAPSCTNEEGER